jgi:hypothetical protein
MWGIMKRKVFGLAFLALLLAVACQADAAPLEKVACQYITISVPAVSDADWTECYRAKQREQGERADAVAADYQVMLSDMRSHVLMIETGKAGNSTYFFKDSIQSRLKDFDELEDRSDFAEEPEFEDYKLVRFQAELWKKPTDCVGFLKYTHARYTQGGGAGAGTYTLGYDCWRDGAPDRKTVEALLTSVKW